LPDFSWCNIPKRGEYTKRPQINHRPGEWKNPIGKVTRRVCEKIAQNVAQPIFVKIINRGNRVPKIWANSVSFQNCQNKPITQ
jgi:hypothetical protein